MTYDSRVGFPTFSRCLSALLLFFALSALGACAEPREEPTEDTLAALDSLLAELGAPSAAQLSRSQRWRMIGSIGAGLPPVNLKAADLPEPGSRGAGLLTAYCVQCHWLPSPAMHAAAEWPLLLRRMKLRVETLGDQMGGPLTAELLGEVRLAGFASSYLPEPEDTDTLLAYLQRNALPVAEPGDVGSGPDARLFVERCSICHETPSPDAHTPQEWQATVERMQANRRLTGMDPMSAADRDRIVAYLSE